MTFAEIPYGSKAYDDECALRHAVLRAPLGLNLWDEDLAAEVSQQHFGLFARDSALLACAVVVPLSPLAVKIRQMAVREDCQRRGYGRELITRLIANLSAAGILEVFLHARTTVAGFYTALDFNAFGAPFTEVGIPHIRMSRTLQKRPR